jgi:uncharacterized protein (TIGR03086 family)
MSANDDAAVLRRALDQLEGLLEGVPAGASSGPTPCTDWTVGDLVDHVVDGPAKFARMLRGEPVDWSATPVAGEQPAPRFRANADDLLAAWRGAGADVPVPVDWQCAELAVHTWDLATALGSSTAGLDPEPAERGLAFMRASLTDENRSPAFGPERPAPDDADPYRRLAAFAGRSV